MLKHVAFIAALIASTASVAGNSQGSAIISDKEAVSTYVVA